MSITTKKFELSLDKIIYFIGLVFISGGIYYNFNDLVSKFDTQVKDLENVKKEAQQEIELLEIEQQKELDIVEQRLNKKISIINDNTDKIHELELQQVKNSYEIKILKKDIQHNDELDKLRTKN